MKNTKSLILLFFVSMAVLYSGIAIGNTSPENLENPPDEFEILVNYLENNTDLISNEAMPIINADEVKKNLKNPKYHLIDIRNEGWFEYGHIKGANNLKAADLLNYFENTINPEDFEKIVLVCYSGQSASYFSGLLRIAGYDNVYSMKWGMSSWREDFADGYWLKNVSNDNASAMETAETVKPEGGVHPTLVTGKTEGDEILKARLTELFELPYGDFVLKSPDVIENSSDYYIVNFTAKETFELGHIAGAVNYLPGSSFASTTDLKTLPTDKKIVVYSDTGLEAAYIVAYLNVLGYEVSNMAYGANGIFNSTMKKAKLNAFTSKEINMFPVIE